jgi:molecular chaperone GrpE
MKKTDEKQNSEQEKKCCTEECCCNEHLPPKEDEASLDYKDKYLRMLAEVENTRKRLHKEKHETIRFAVENTILEILPAIDNFENALKFAQNSSLEVKNWVMGFQMILSQFKDVLYNHGIVAFHSEGNIYDPHLHEAMEIVETNDVPDGTILEEFAKGYKTEQRTIRPAKVKVAKKAILENSQDEELKNSTN